jgi:hypothetical protein
VRERLVRVSHAMCILTLLHCRATILDGVQKLIRETVRKLALAAVSRSLFKPTKR